MSAGHNMSLFREEIESQPNTLQATLDVVGPAASAIASEVGEPPMVILLGRGSSHHAAVFGRYLFEVTCERQALIGAPSIHSVYRPDVDLHGVLAVAISQSGETEDVAAALADMRRCGARTVAVTNDPASTLASRAEYALLTQAGEEQAVPATKTHTAQLLAVACLARAFSSDPLLERGIPEVPAAVARALASADRVEALIPDIRHNQACFVIAGGFALATALEVALKLTEACRVVAVGQSTAEFLHGRVAAAGPDVPVLAFAPPGRSAAHMGGVADRVAAVGGGMLLVTGDEALLGTARRSVLVDCSLPESLAPIAYLVLGQILADRLATALGLDPDHPPGLRKVTRMA
jgi:glucosamine--fructose-6-phosphate aminotransferase (isomerizing)